MSPTIELRLVGISLVSDLPLLGFSVDNGQARELTSHLGGPISGLERHTKEPTISNRITIFFRKALTWIHETLSYSFQRSQTAW